MITSLSVSDPTLVTVAVTLSILAEIQSFSQGFLATERVLINITAISFEPDAVLTVEIQRFFTVDNFEEKLKDEKCDHVLSGRHCAGTSAALLVGRWNRFDQNNSWMTDRQTDRLTR